MKYSILLLSIAFSLITLPANSQGSDLYDFRIDRQFLQMQDGMKLAVTYFRPVPKKQKERFPVLLELLPYRKDDSFYARDYPLYSYFVKRGFMLAKVDVRGTGGSEGAVPDREYSEAELNDAVEIISQLAKIPGSNGSVGMWGISWGGFNAIQVAMRRPPELKAILALHASDELYHDDVRYIDGILHMDPYALQIDHENGLPRTTDYPLDEAYFRDRFEAHPWILTYLHQPVDGEFWRKNALMYRYDAIQVPCYLIGGLLDGYRDTVPRMLENMKVPIIAEIGPWMHDWPDNGQPGPHYEWRARAVRWWNHWLKGEDTGILQEPRFAVFVRDSHLPDADLQMTPGKWRNEEWPIARTEFRLFYPEQDHQLLESYPEAKDVSLGYDPGYGIQADDWWGDPTGDMRPDDAGSLIFDSPLLEETIEIIGFPQVSLRVSSDAPLANWIVRLEDVHPDGAVSLVTGAAINGTQRESSTHPEPLEPEKVYDLKFPLHFTTWTFRPGHRIRMAVTNAQFPMFWPSPYSMMTHLVTGESTLLRLPVIPPAEERIPNFPKPENRERRPGVTSLESDEPSVKRAIYDQEKGTLSVEWISQGGSNIDGTKHLYSEREFYEVSRTEPSKASFVGEASTEIHEGERIIRLETTITIHSDLSALHVSFLRKIFLNEQLLREKEWKEDIPRKFH